MSRIPLPPFPNGWFALRYAHELERGAVRRVHFLGRDFVLFRGEDGKAHALDPYCPHLGAHLGVRGKVCGDRIECAFHGWRFEGETGRCVEIPYAKRVPPQAAVKTWPLLEQNELLYVYHHAQGAAPEWTPDAIPEVGHPDYVRWGVREWTIRSHPQEVMENGVDYAHFQTLHKWAAVALRWTPKGERYSLEIDVDTEAAQQAATASHALTVNSYNSGPGFLFTRIRGAMDGIAMNMLTPVDRERLLVRHAYYAKKTVPRETAEAFFAAYEADWALDFPLWDNKIHRMRPVLADTEGDVPRFRKWYRQFYTDKQVAEAEAAAG